MKKILIALIIILPVYVSGQNIEKVFLEDCYTQKSNGDYTPTGYMAYASSTLSSKTPGRYAVCNLFDNNLATAWVEGATGNGAGEYIIIAKENGFNQNKINLTIKNGYQKSDYLYKANNRVKQLQVTVLLIASTDFVSETGTDYAVKPIGQPVTITIADKKESQNFVIGIPQTTGQQKQALRNFIKQETGEAAPEPTFYYGLKIKILETYKGTKYDDTCISEISF